MGQIQSFEELFAFLLRRARLILAVALIGTLAAAIYAKSRPDSYEAAAVIQVETSTVSGSNGQPATSSAAQILQSIEQRLTTRENLTAMIERHGLYADLPGLSLEKKLVLLRSSVTFQGVDSAAGQNFGQARNLSAIIISARMGDAELAARVANDFAQGVLDRSASGSRERAAQNVAFFAEDVTRIGNQIATLEAEIASYKNAHAAALPTQSQTLRDELSGLDGDLRRLSQDRIAAEGEAATLRAKETLRETDRRQLDEITRRLDVIDTQIATAQTRRDELQAALAGTPEVERVMAGYDLMLSQLQDQYEIANRRKAEADTDLRLAERQQAERLTLLDRAITPEYPMGGGGKKIAIAGALASLMAGLGLAFLLDLMHPVVRTAAQMERQLDLRPVVSIPEIRTQKRRGLLDLGADRGKPLLGLTRNAMIVVATAVMALVAGVMAWTAKTR
ncbi:GumC family protein [Tabrizicola fusiformis]|uniref:GumC family protein n=1 Tax=Tabrizicola sp. SY72 TaxID=2741673 RepID=UPI0015726A42|nr:Wzz/FepE/Etk N-terminal domain-containing protein [Tabrizicola sp. SY72]NTT84575.1 hypothetical protein [Tabrizicola sp. SY72]